VFKYFLVWFFPGIPLAMFPFHSCCILLCPYVSSDFFGVIKERELKVDLYEVKSSLVRRFLCVRMVHKLKVD